MGCAVEMHDMSSVRDAWESHTVLGYYIGVSKEHYRCHKVWVKDTRSVRVGNTVFFKHKYLTMPTLMNSDTLVNVANDLKIALEDGIPQTNANKDVLDKFVEIFKVNAQAYQEETAVSQRVHKAVQDQRVRRAAAKYRQQDLPIENPTGTVPKDKSVQIPIVSPDNDDLQMTRLRQRGKTCDLSKLKQINGIPQDDEAPACNTQANHQARTLTQEVMLQAMEMVPKQAQVTARQTSSRQYPLEFLTEYANVVLDPSTGELLEYCHLIQNPSMIENGNFHQAMKLDRWHKALETG